MCEIVVSHLSPPQRLLGGGRDGRGKKKVRLGRREDGKASQCSPRAFVYPLPSLQIAYTAKEHAERYPIGIKGLIAILVKTKLHYFLFFINV